MSISLKKRHSITVALIVKNEAKNLAACLDTISNWVDEIVILDSGSTDNTKEIAAKYKAKFYSNNNWPGFGAQRQLAQSYVTTDFVLWLDADERITPILKTSIENVLTKPNIEDKLYSISRLSWVFGRYIKHCGWYPDKVVRLYPTKLTNYNDSLVHEKVIVPAHCSIENLQGDAIHYTYNDLNHYLVKSAGYAKAWAEQRALQGKTSSLLKGYLHAVGCFIKMYIIKAGFLDGKQGLLLSTLSAHSTFVKYADLWIKTQTEPPKKK